MVDTVRQPWAVLGGMLVLALAAPAPADAFWGHRRTVVSTGYALPSVPTVVTTAPAPVVVARPVFGMPGVVVPSTGTIPALVTPLPQALPAGSAGVTTYYAPPVTYAPPAGYAPPASIPSAVTVPPASAVTSPMVAPAATLPVVPAPRPTIVVPGGGMMLRRPILVVP